MEIENVTEALDFKKKDYLLFRITLSLNISLLCSLYCRATSTESCQFEKFNRILSASFKNEKSRQLLLLPICGTITIAIAKKHPRTIAIVKCFHRTIAIAMIENFSIDQLCRMPLNVLF